MATLLDLAAWWCDLNAGRWPHDLKHPAAWNAMSPEERQAAAVGAWRVLDEITFDAGRALWHQRLRDGDTPYHRDSEELG